MELELKDLINQKYALEESLHLHFRSYDPEDRLENYLAALDKLHETDRAIDKEIKKQIKKGDLLAIAYKGRIEIINRIKSFEGIDDDIFYKAMRDLEDNNVFMASQGIDVPELFREITMV